MLVGLDDEWTGALDADEARGRDVDPASGPIVCLNHNPVNARDLLSLPVAVDAQRPHARPAGGDQQVRPAVLP